MTAHTLHELRETLDQLEARVAAQERELVALRSVRQRRRDTGMGRRARRLGRVAVVLAAVVLAALPLGLLAASTFSDVPANHPNAKEIYAISTAGITKGCGGDPTVYCPAAPVTRDQMAVFLNRGLGRLGTTVWSQPALTSNAPFASTQITTEGTEYVVATASFYTVVYEGQPANVFPCEGTFSLRMDGATDPNSLSGVSVSSAPGAPYRTDTISTQGVFLAGPGQHTIDVLFVQSRGTCNINMGVGRLVAQVVPFGSTGAAAAGLNEPQSVPTTLGGR